MTEGPLNLLVVGVGSIGERHVRCFQAAGQVRLSVCDTDRQLLGRVAERYGIERTYTDFDAALGDTHHAAVIATPAHLHIPMAKRLVEAGADGLALFNRFLQPDIDLEEMEIVPRLKLSSSFELLLPLRWIAILRGRVETSLAVTSGIHDADGLLKAVAAGADIGMLASVLYRRKFEVIGKMLTRMTEWLEEKEYESVEQMKGCMSQANCPEPAAFERGNYMKALTSFTSDAI